MIYLILFLDIIFTVAAQLSLRTGAVRLNTASISINFFTDLLKNGFLILGLGFFAIGFFLYILVLSKLQLNIVYPIATGMTLAIITIITHFFLKESLGAIQAVGIGAIIVGIIMVLLPR